MNDRLVHSSIAHLDFPDPRTAWDRLTQGRTIGTSVNLLCDTSLPGKGDFPQDIGVLQIEGTDSDAMDLCVTLLPPLLIPTASIPDYGTPTFNLNGNFSFHGSNQSAGVNSVFTDLYAVVEWGIGGKNVRAEVDIGNGAVVGVQASWLRVKMAIDLVGGAAGDPAVYLASAFVGPGGPRGGTRSQRTIAAGATGTVNAGATSAPKPVPTVASYATLIWTTAQAPVYSLIFYRDAAGTIEVGRYQYTATSGQITAKIPNGGYYFSILNGGAAPAAFRCIFDLTI